MANTGEIKIRRKEIPSAAVLLTTEMGWWKNPLTGASVWEIQPRVLTCLAADEKNGCCKKGLLRQDNWWCNGVKVTKDFGGGVSRPLNTVCCLRKPRR